MLLAGVFKIPIIIALSVVAGILVMSIAASVLLPGGADATDASGRGGERQQIIVKVCSRVLNPVLPEEMHA
jgi:hypothetical protein